MTKNSSNGNGYSIPPPRSRGPEYVSYSRYGYHARTCHTMSCDRGSGSYFNQQNPGFEIPYPSSANRFTSTQGGDQSASPPNGNIFSTCPVGCPSSGFFEEQR